MQTKADDLALHIINTGEGYQDRCNGARLNRDLGSMYFWRITKEAARRYEHKFRTLPEIGTWFTTSDVLAAATKVAEYYEEHVKEMKG